MQNTGDRIKKIEESSICNLKFEICNFRSAILNLQS
jgi:hypothetical protein